MSSQSTDVIQTDGSTVTAVGTSTEKGRKRGGKVVHLSDELHAQIRAYCEALETTMKEWVEATLKTAIAQPPARMPVKTKPVVEFEQETDDELWNRPPFWTQRSRNKPKDETGS